MASRQAICITCKNPIWIMHKTWQKYRDMYGYKSFEQMNCWYECRRCRSTKKQKKILDFHISKHQDKKYANNLKYDIQTEVNTLIKRGKDDLLARQNFINNVTDIIKKQGINEFEFIVDKYDNNNLIGIRLKKVSLLGDVYLEINGKGNQKVKKHEKLQSQTDDIKPIKYEEHNEQ